MSPLTAFNFREWIEQHREHLKPPVCNRQVFRHSELIIMVVGGPNSRKDYHLDPGDEFFYQLEGDMLLKTQQDGKPVVFVRRGRSFEPRQVKISDRTETHIVVSDLPVGTEVALRNPLAEDKRSGPSAGPVQPAAGS